MQVNGYIKKGPLIFLIVCAVLLSAYVIVEYGFFAFTEPPAPLTERAEVQRGSILDRNGKALAVPAAFYDFGASPQSIKNKETFAEVIAPVIGESESSILSLISKSENASFIYIKKISIQTLMQNYAKPALTTDSHQSSNLTNCRGAFTRRTSLRAS